MTERITAEQARAWLDSSVASDIHTIQLEQRLYPDELSRHRLMSDVIAVAKGIRYVQNVAAVVGPDDGNDTNGMEVEGANGMEVEDADGTEVEGANGTEDDGA